MILTRPEPGRSQRDELERLQEELRAARLQREVLPRENAELASQVERLEQETRWLRRSLEVARDEAERPAPSLPDQLVPPFRAIPSRRTAYGRARFALQATGTSVPPILYYMPSLIDSPRSLAILGLILLLGIVVLLFLQGPEDDEEGLSWRFDDEGLSPTGPGVPSGKIRYPEIQQVQKRQGPLQRLYGFGTVRIIWRPGAPTSLGKPVSYPNRSVDIDQLDDPDRLADWLRGMARQGHEKGHEQGEGERRVG